MLGPECQGGNLNNQKMNQVVFFIFGYWKAFSRVRLRYEILDL